jgi:hypothetical protein
LSCGDGFWVGVVVVVVVVVVVGLSPVAPG